MPCLIIWSFDFMPLLRWKVVVLLNRKKVYGQLIFASGHLRSSVSLFDLQFISQMGSLIS